jgi:hypothetical protein
MTDKIHSPFLCIEHFISPGTCERLVEEFGIKDPTVVDGHALKNERILKDGEFMLMFKDAVQEQVGRIEDQYNGRVVGMEPPVFQQYFEDPRRPCESAGCENAKYLRKKWVKMKDVDLVGYIWLKDYNNGIPLDPRFETYGGKLEFPAYDFSLIPQRGMLALYPAGPHFISAISPILVGSLEQIKITIKLKNTENGMWIYQPANFPGTYQEWFSEE